MFDHSIRVPRHYKIASNILKKVSTEGGSVKTLLYDEKFRHFRTNVIFALITETIKHSSQLDKIFETSGILLSEPRLDPWLAKILTAEILYGKKTLPGKSKPEQTILSYKDKFQKCNDENGESIETKDIPRPRYVRINTNLLTTSDAIRAFQEEGYKFIRCTSGSYDDYLQQIKNLTEYDFTQDYHVKTMFVFPPGTKLHDHDLYHENKIILQDKATALPVHLLAPPPGSVVLDMCAAPGMKTTQIAAYIKNQGKVYAVERNKERYETLCDFVNKTESKCVQTLNMDALELKRGDYDDVEYILLDPSCSGSGMAFSVHNYVDKTRLARLTSLQEKFLKHAMNAFPNARKIVYSTCSVFPEENERVITNVVKFSRARWRVQDVKDMLKGQWNNFGSGMYGTIGARCLYAKPESDCTTGFFLAVLERDESDIEKCKIKCNENKMKKQELLDNVGESENSICFGNDLENKGNKNKSEQNISHVTLDESEESLSKKTKKKKKRNSLSNHEENGEKGKVNLQDETVNIDECAFESDVISYTKKKKKDTILTIESENHMDDTNVNPSVNKGDLITEKIKKKKNKNNEFLSSENLSVIKPNHSGNKEEMATTSNDIITLKEDSLFSVKKKKKGLNSELGNSVSVSNCNGNKNVQANNKTDVDLLTNTDDTLIQNKKRKKKEKIELNDNLLMTPDSVNDNISVSLNSNTGDSLNQKKKKKKRDKDIVVCDNLIVDVSESTSQNKESDDDGAILTIKKSKKKKDKIKEVIDKNEIDNNMQDKKPRKKSQCDEVNDTLFKEKLSKDQNRKRKHYPQCEILDNSLNRLNSEDEPIKKKKKK